MERIEGYEIGMHDNKSCNEEENADESLDDSDLEEKDREEQFALERRVVEIRKELSKMPNAYTLHVELIAALTKLGELDQLRYARESMHTVFPLSEDLWLEWIRDEIKLGTTDEEREKTEMLFKRATQDYLSIDVWLEYINFSLTGLGNACVNTIKKIRAIMEDAVRHGGLHVVKGALLWDSYREFELALYQSTKGSDGEHLAQKHITQLFQRQLSIPLLDIDRTWNEFNEWLHILGKEPEAHVKASYDKAKNWLEKVAPLEDTLLIAVDNIEKAAVYRAYLDVEINYIKDPARIQALYERIVSEMPLDPAFWNNYCEYVDRQFKVADTTLTLYNRAVRNCSWNSTLWADYIFVSERYQKEHNFITGLVEKAFSAGLTSASDYKAVWLAFIEYVVRICKWDKNEDVEQVREAFTRAIDHLTLTFSAEGDPECMILQYWAYIEAKNLQNITKAREIWGKIISQGHSKSAQWWLAYIQFERTHGNDLSLVRKLFTKSLNAVESNDWPESIVQQWLQFEREEGDLETMETARLKCRARMMKLKEEREKQPLIKEEGAGEEKINGRKRGNKDNETGQHVNKHNKKSEPPPKKSKMVDSSNIVLVKKANILLAPAKPPPIVPQAPTDPSRHARTVFVSNLDYSFTEDDIRTTMSASGTITDIRLIRDYKQRSKGYCYVEFSSELEARAALKRDREPLKNRPMFISPSEPDAALKHPAFKFQNSLEKRKLFVKGLATSTTKKDVEKLFSHYGAIKDVRLVTFKSGISKGLAYVDFEDEVSASTALMKTDGSTFQDRVLTVALSNPPPRRDNNVGHETKDETTLLGGGARSRRTQVSFVPNSVLKQTQITSSSTNSMLHPLAPVSGQKSNDDFRSMLLRK